MFCKWEETQDNMKLTMQRNIFGIHAPVRQLMERKIVAFVGINFSPPSSLLISAQNPHMPGMPQSNLQLDILMGRDEIIEPVDIFSGAFLVYRDHVFVY